MKDSDSYNLEDYKQAMENLAWTQFVQMRQAVGTLRDQYAIMHHFITKNLSVITQPRSQDNMNMY